MADARGRFLHWLSQGMEPEDRTPKVTSIHKKKGKTTLSDVQRSGLVDAADPRDHPVFAEIDELLTRMAPHYPLQVRKVRSDIKWLRGVAHSCGYSWGKKKWL